MDQGPVVIVAGQVQDPRPEVYQVIVSFAETRPTEFAARVLRWGVTRAGGPNGELEYALSRLGTRYVNRLHRRLIRRGLVPEEE